MFSAGLLGSPDTQWAAVRIHLCSHDGDHDDHHAHDDEYDDHHGRDYDHDSY